MYSCSVHIKILNPVGRGYLDFSIERDADFSMERDALPSHPVPTLETENVLRHPDWDARTLTGRPSSDTWDSTLSRCPTGRPTGT